MYMFTQHIQLMMSDNIKSIDKTSQNDEFHLCFPLRKLPYIFIHVVLPKLIILGVTGCGWFYLPCMDGASCVINASHVFQLEMAIAKETGFMWRHSTHTLKMWLAILGT